MSKEQYRMSEVRSRYSKKTKKLFRKISRLLKGDFDNRSALFDKDDNISVIINLVYDRYLQRLPDPTGYSAYRQELKKGLPLAKFVARIAESSEAQQKNLVPVTLQPVASSHVEAEPALRDSDGEFIMGIGQVLCQGTAARPKEIEYYKTLLKEKPENRLALIRRLTDEHMTRHNTQAEPKLDGHECWIMGTERFLTPKLWNERVSKLGITPTAPTRPPLSERRFQHSGTYRVSAVASLYRGRQFLEAFLENIVSQTIFAESELIIIDADSPEGERELIEKYAEVYPNIVYKRMNYRIGIYDAWNVGVQMARGKYVTNTNLDDLRREDSLEIQARTLDQHDFIDVVYQDFLYSLDASFSVADVAKCDFKSNVPVITVNNMLEFNSPHNAPMWRRKLHDEIGYFDTTYKSAGDYEFWLRCLLHNKTFLKINDPHVVYFQNPEGISTAPNSRGIQEARRIWHEYASKLISPHLAMSRADFARALGTEPNWGWEVPSYEVVQRRLRAIGDEMKTASRDDV